MKNTEKNNSNNSANNTINRAELLELAKNAFLQVEATEKNKGRKVAAILGEGWVYDESKKTAASGKQYQARTLLYNGAKVCRIDNLTGSNKGCTTNRSYNTANVNFVERITSVLQRFENVEKTEEEDISFIELANELTATAAKIEAILQAANNRAAEEARAAAKEKRLNEKATKEAAKVTDKEAALKLIAELSAKFGL